MGGSKNNAECAMTQDQMNAIQAISQSYLHNFKPLLQVLKVRMKGKYPQNCLNEIRAINDHIARCHRNGMSEEDITKEIGKAEGHLQRLAYDCYKQEKILERHRHRYEFNNKYKELLEQNGLIISGINEQANLVEIVELPSNDFFIACQFHPEFKSRPTRPHPLFDKFVKSSIDNKKKK